MISPDIDRRPIDDNVRAMKRLLITTLPMAAGVAIVAVACWLAILHPRPVDFMSFWKAARLVADGATAIELPYPPPFLFFIGPLGLIDFGFAFSLWVVITGAIYAFASNAPARLSLANPPAIFNGTIGQNGFLTAAIMLGAAQLVRTRPIVAGGLFGLMVIKPHLAVLVPIALLADRQWRAVLAAAASSVGLIMIAAAVFGPAAYLAFFETGREFAALLQSGTWPWSKLASVFAFLRWFGIEPPVAYAIHAAIALAGGFLVWRAWSTDWDCRVAVLAAASILVTPYLFTYDAVILIAPIAWLAARSPKSAALVWLLTLPPLLGAFDLYAGPNTIGIAAIIALWFLVRSHAKVAREQLIASPSMT